VKSLILFKSRLDPERVIRGRSFVIEATGLVRTYDQGEEKVFALRGVDLAVREGEFLAITGPSGSMKDRFA
jgi:predicted ABC-type transport system involved in lysophospholipase L1 biosynthesis ATPase subunit